MNPTAEDSALLALGRALQSAGYTFTTITPESHARVNARPGNALAQDLRGVFGWSRAFAPGAIPESFVSLLESAGALENTAAGRRSKVRFSTLGERLYVHSAFPTLSEDSVFFGPDTYRFAAFLTAEARPARRLVDVGCGSGAGGLHLADRCQAMTLTDINPRAVRWARVNAAVGGVRHAEAQESDLLSAVRGEVDLIVSNPPYLVDTTARTYRHGGTRGFELSARIVEESLARLVPGGQLLLYTGAPVANGEDLFFAAIRPRLEAARCAFTYRELDPDVFGEELDREEYADVERLCVVGLNVTVR